MSFTTEPKLEQRAAQPYVGIRMQVPVSEFDRVIPESHSEIMQWLKQQGIEPSGAPFMRYHVINMPGLMDIEMGWPIAQPIEGNGRIQAGVLPAGEYGSLVYTGLNNGVAGNKALLEWAETKGIRWDHWDTPEGDAFRSRIETFITDPDDEPDINKWDTEVAIRVADR